MTVRALISEVLTREGIRNEHFSPLRLFLKSTATAQAAPGAGSSEPSLLLSSQALLVFDQSQAHVWHLIAEARLHGDSSVPFKLLPKVAWAGFSKSSPLTQFRRLPTHHKRFCLFGWFFSFSNS